MAKPKIYLITPKERADDTGLSLPSQRLIRANSSAQALGFAARTSLTVELAGQDDLIDCVRDGIYVESALDLIDCVRDGIDVESALDEPVAASVAEPEGEPA